MVVAFVLSGCSADSPVAVPSLNSPLTSGASQLAVTSLAPLLYTTLDGVASVLSPVNGTGAGAVISTLPANNFVAAHLSKGLLANAVAERITYRQSEQGVQNVELDRGTMDFWFRPNFDSNDDMKYTIAGSGNWRRVGSRGSLHLGKHNKSNSNQIFLIFFDANSARFEHRVLASDYSWKAGVWQHLVITWDFKVAAGHRNLHLYLNDAELPLTGQVTRGPQSLPAEMSSEEIYIGSRGPGQIAADGLYDEFRIYDRVIRPSGAT